MIYARSFVCLVWDSHHRSTRESAEITAWYVSSCTRNQLPADCSVIHPQFLRAHVMFPCWLRCWFKQLGIKVVVALTMMNFKTKTWFILATATKGQICALQFHFPY